MQHAIGDHALLADGRTAALLDPDGNVAWMCWPRVDSAPMLLSILDESGGGRFTVRPAGATEQPDREYHERSLVLRTAWRVPGGRLVVDDALALGAAQALLRRVRADGRDIDVEVCFAPGDRDATLAAHGDSMAVAGGVPLRVDSGGPWSRHEGEAVSRFTVPEGQARLVALHDGDAPLSVSAIDDTITAWRARLRASRAYQPSQVAAASVDPRAFEALAVTSVCALLGLLQETGGIVAAPTTSLPQWPRSSRTWDYRHCWMRDASLAGLALARAGHVAEAHAIGAFLGDAVMEHGPRPVFRVDGGLPPEEREQPQLGGFRGALPVRFGNAAAVQAQLDAPAELMELGWTLAAHEHLPASLAAAMTLCADWMTQHWREPDHGIWEIRGAPRQYTHSRVMASAAMRGAAALASRGVISGDGDAWGSAADAAQREVRPAKSGALELHADGGGADAALALVAHVGFLQARDVVNTRTLELIRERLDRDGLLERYEGRPDSIADPCFPFVFPTFWMAEAAHAAGLDGERHFRAAVSTRSAFNLFGEVADPDERSPQGNYPQVQSHAAFLMCTTEGGSGSPLAHPPARSQLRGSEFPFAD